MPLSLNEIRERARAFAREWAEETSERAEAQSFWNGFFCCLGDGSLPGRPRIAGAVKAHLYLMHCHS